MNNILRDNANYNNQKQPQQWDELIPQYMAQKEEEPEYLEVENKNFVHIMNKENYSHGKYFAK